MQESEFPNMKKLSILKNKNYHHKKQTQTDEEDHTADHFSSGWPCIFSFLVVCMHSLSVSACFTKSATLSDPASF
jgi:hypothetical protein